MSFYLNDFKEHLTALRERSQREGVADYTEPVRPWQNSVSLTEAYRGMNGKSNGASMLNEWGRRRPPFTPPINPPTTSANPAAGPDGIPPRPPNPYTASIRQQQTGGPKQGLQRYGKNYPSAPGPIDGWPPHPVFSQSNNTNPPSVQGETPTTGHGGDPWPGGPIIDPRYPRRTSWGVQGKRPPFEKGRITPSGPRTGGPLRPHGWGDRWGVQGKTHPVTKGTLGTHSPTIGPPLHRPKRTVPTTQSGPGFQTHQRSFGDDIVYRPKPGDPRWGVRGKQNYDYGPHKPWPRYPGRKHDPRRGTSARQKGGDPFTTPGFPSGGPWQDGGPSPT